MVFHIQGCGTAVTDSRPTARMIVLLAVLATIALLANVVGWVPVASGGGVVAVIGAVAHWVMVHRRRQHDLREL